MPLRRSGLHRHDAQAEAQATGQERQGPGLNGRSWRTCAIAKNGAKLQSRVRFRAGCCLRQHRVRVSAGSNGVVRSAWQTKKPSPRSASPTRTWPICACSCARRRASFSHDWRWGSDTRADLLVVDPAEFRRADGAHARQDHRHARRHRLRRRRADRRRSGALSPAQVRQRRRRAERGRRRFFGVLRPGVGAVGSLFLGDSRRMAEFELEQPADGFPEEDRVQRRPGSEVAPGLDELIRGNPLADPYLNLKPAKLDESTAIENTGDQTRRSELRADRERESQAVPLGQSTPVRTPVKSAERDRPLGPSSARISRRQPARRARADRLARCRRAHARPQAQGLPQRRNPARTRSLLPRIAATQRLAAADHGRTRPKSASRNPRSRTRS